MRPSRAVPADRPVGRSPVAAREQRGKSTATGGGHRSRLPASASRLSGSGRGQQLAGVALGGVAGASPPSMRPISSTSSSPSSCSTVARAALARESFTSRKWVGQRGDLRQVGDADAPAGRSPSVAQPLADGAGGVAADAGVDLVEDQGAGAAPPAPSPVSASITRESSPPEAASRSGAGSIPGLGATRSSTASAPFGAEAVGVRLEHDLERRARHRERARARPPTRSLERRRRLRSRPGSARFASFARRAAASASAVLELGGPLLGVLEPLDLRPAALGVGEHRLDVAAVLSLQAVERARAAPRSRPDAPGRPRSRRGRRAARRRRRRARPRARASRSPIASSAGVDPADRRQQRLGRGERAGAPPPSSSVGPAIAAAARRRPPRAGPRRGAAARARPPSSPPRPGRAPPPRSRRARSGSRSRSRSRAPSRSRSSASSRVEPHGLAVSLAVARRGARGARRRRSRRGSRAGPRRSSACGARAGRRRRAGAPPSSFRSAAEAARPGDEGAGPPGGARPAGRARSPRRPPGSRSASSASSGSSSSPAGRSKTPSTQASSAPGPDDLRARLAAHQQVERVGEDGLPGPGLAGDRVQALAEAQLGPLDQQQVLDPQLAQHALCLAAAADGFAQAAGAARRRGSAAAPRASPATKSLRADEGEAEGGADEGDERRRSGGSR